MDGNAGLMSFQLKGGLAIRGGGENGAMRNAWLHDASIPACTASRLVAWVVTALLLLVSGTAHAATPWQDDLAPIEAREWNAEHAAHLLERAGFGGTPQEIARLAAMTPRDAVRSLVKVKPEEVARLPPFQHSGIFEPGLDPFPPSRPAATDAAKANGEALGIKVKPSGNRRLQPVVNQFFYWLRASRLETHRIAYWWAERMLTTPAPLQEKMALFWHGHFATSEEKVRDYRKMLAQLELFQTQGLGDFRTLMVGVAQDPAMLAFLDAGVNVKGAPNENFAREIMELFTMGVGHYSETDIREAARAFTGWNYRGLEFRIDATRHDDGVKQLLGTSGPFDGVAVIDLILCQPVTAEFLAGKIYRHFVREELTPATQKALADRLRASGYRIAPLLETIFLSKDFYSPASRGTHIKAPVELVISTYRKLGLASVPGLPDFNDVTRALGQQLFVPPTVAGWPRDRAWITPGLLIERGNFAHDLLFAHFTALPPDRYPSQQATGDEIRVVHERIRAGQDMTSATQPAGKDANAPMAMSNQMADRDEDFNTRYGSYRGWQMAVERVKPIPRNAAPVDLSAMVKAAGCRSSAESSTSSRRASCACRSPPRARRNWWRSSTASSAHRASTRR